jgi:hypothetical protein
VLEETLFTFLGTFPSNKYMSALHQPIAGARLGETFQIKEIKLLKNRLFIVILWW